MQRKDVTTAPALAFPSNNNSTYLIIFCNAKNKGTHATSPNYKSRLTLGVSNGPGSTAAAIRSRPSKKLICEVRMAKEAAQV